MCPQAYALTASPFKSNVNVLSTCTHLPSSLKSPWFGLTGSLFLAHHFPFSYLENWQSSKTLSSLFKTKRTLDSIDDLVIRGLQAFSRWRLPFRSPTSDCLGSKWETQRSRLCTLSRLNSSTDGSMAGNASLLGILLLIRILYRSVWGPCPGMCESYSCWLPVANAGSGVAAWQAVSKWMKKPFFSEKDWGGMEHPIKYS